MFELVPLQPVDYLVIGHLAMDLTPRGKQLGGTAAYSGLTARALGLRVGIVTSMVDTEISLDVLNGIPVVNIPAEHSTTFENIQTENGRKQILHHRAAPILFEHIPPAWRDAKIIHLAPLADEVDSTIAEKVSAALLGITPQGWMRAWDENGNVKSKLWKDESALNRAGAVVLSVDDVSRDLELVEEMSHHTRILCLTEGAAGAVLYWNGDRRRFRPPLMDEVDSTGAGDIFAAAFFIRLLNTRDPWEAARFANQLAARSVSRVGLDGIPTLKEIEECSMEVIQ